VTDNPLGTTCATFEQTGKKVCGVFLLYWQANGALAQQGLPLSDLFIETNPTDGKPYPTQYFERARFEYHVENLNTPYVVLLGLLGREQLCAKYTACDPTKPPPSPSPSPSPSNVIFQDDFTNPNGGWPTLKDPQGRYELGYLPGEYRIAIAAANYLALVTNTTVAAQTDVQIEVDTTRFGPPTNILYGLACRNSASGAYLGLIAIDGSVAIFKVGTGGSTILSIGQSAAVKPGEQTNRVRFDCVGSNLTLYVNGTMVASAQDSTYGNGRFAVVGFTSQQGGLDLHLRNFILYRR